MNLKLRNPTPGDIAALEIVERITGVYQMAGTGRDFRRSVALRCEAAGWLESGQCVTVDGDGFLPNGNERWGIGFKLTDAGRIILKDAHRERDMLSAKFKELWEARDKLQAELSNTKALLSEATSSRVLTCVYCGHEYPANTPATGTNVALTEHIAECEHHPMRAVVDLLKEAAHALDGDDLIQHRSAKFREWFTKNQTGLGQR